MILPILRRLVYFGAVLTLTGMIGLWWLKFDHAWLCFALGSFLAVFFAILHEGFRDCRGSIQVARKEPMRVICAWCHIELQAGVEPISHGCCPLCAKIHFGYHREGE